MVMKDNDWQGRPVPENENPESIIKVWEIEPAMDSSFTHEVVRSYQHAKYRAALIVEDLMDHYEIQNEPVKIEVRLIEMKLSDYLELLDERDR